MLRLALLGWIPLSVSACEAFGTIDLGDNPPIRTMSLDLDFFVCRIQPEVLSASGCASGDEGEAGSCHADQSSYRLRAVDPAYASGCDEGVHPSPPGDVLVNFDATELWILEDVESSPLLTRPTADRSHPRAVFSSESVQADLIREWVSVQR